ncbi:MAG: hypothetical protein PHT41_02200 [Candidatus Omnitrophica bacterium]|nr:hypothetical protein [Candidatus Omnitrophota bacterium]MDD5238118.1 hypothetical protein [Candidatus Omnitrophota bacterium]
MKKVRTSCKGRRCKFPRCKHILSIYNHEAYCHVHLSLVDVADRQKISKA